MPEVGVLDLKINAKDTSDAAGSLKTLAGALRELDGALSNRSSSNLVTLSNELVLIKTAVKGGIKLSPVADEIAELTTKIDAYIGKGVIGKINQLSAALQEIQKASNFKLPNLSDYKKFQSYLDSIEKKGKSSKSAMESIRGSVDSVTSGIHDATNSLAEYTKAWRAVEQTYTTVRSKLESGNSPLLLGDGGVSPSNALSTRVSSGPMWNPGWTHGENYAPDWVSTASRDIGDAIPVEGWIDLKEAIQDTEDILRTVSGTAVEVKNNFDSAAEATERFGNCVDEVNQLMVNMGWSFNDAGEKARDFGDTLRHVFETWNEMRMSMSLGSSNNPLLGAGGGDPNGTGWSYYNPWGDVKETGWVEWRQGAIEVEGTVSDVTENVAGYLENTQLALRDTAQEARNTSDAFYEAKMANERLADEAEQIRAAQEAKFYASDKQRTYTVGETNSMSDNLTQLDLLKAKLREAQVSYNKLVNTLGAGNSKTVKAGLDIQNLKDKIWELKQVATDTNGSAKIDELLGMSKIELKAAQIGAMENALREGAESGRLTEVQLTKMAAAIVNEKDKLLEMTQAQEAANSTTKQLRSAFEDLKKSYSKSGLKKLYDQFWRLVKLRALRYVIRQISSAFSEGIENVYNYSKAIGSTFYQSMDNASNAMNQMKNSIAAAAAPLIQQFIPYIQMAVNWLITIINYINQFISLMTGASTWTHALLGEAGAFDDVADSATGASAAVKDLLADWDELNIIQSDSGGAGSGTGTDAMEDYLNMFEEVSEFDTRIQAIVDRIKDSLVDMKTLVIAIGTAFLAWKLSNLFADKISWLSEMLSIIAGFATLTISVMLSYDSGFHVGSSGEWTDVDIAEGIVGVFLGGLGGWLIGHDTGSIVAGISISLFTWIVGYLKGLNDSEDKMKWGEGSMTPEELEAYVTGLFDFDIVSQITVLDAVLLDQEESKRKLNDKINAFTSSLAKVKIRVDGTPSGITEAAEEAKGVIDQINENLTNSEKNIEVLTKIVPIKEGDGESEENTLLEGVKLADKKLSDYFNDLGKQIAGWIDQGERTGWKENEAAMALELMQHQQAIIDQAEGNRIKRNFQVDTELNLSNYSRDTAQEVFDREVALINEYTSKMEEAYNNQIKELYYYADLADAAGLVDEEGNPLSQAYIAMAEGLLEQVKNGDIYKEIEPAIELMRQQWISTLQSVYGDDITRGVDEHVNMTDVISQWLGNGTFFERGIKSALVKEDTEGAARYIEEELWAIFGAVDPKGITKRAAQTFGFSIVDLLGSDNLNKVISSIYTATGNNADTAIDILTALGLDSITVAEALKANVANGVEDGAEEATAAAKESIEDTVEHEWNQDLMYYDWPWKLPKVKVDTSETEFEIDENGFDEELADAINAALWGSEDWLDAPELMGLAESFNISLQDLLNYASADLPQETLENLQQVVDILNETHRTDLKIPALDTTGIAQSTSAAAGWFEDMANRIRNAMASLDGISWSMDLFGHNSSGGINVSMPAIATAATGGFVRSGDLVMANENGNFEMMGRMGNQPVVANNQQIVSGISQGVSNANGDVVSELRSMATLVQRILNKEFSAKLVPSSSTGRTVAQSAAAYSKVTG